MKALGRIAPERAAAPSARPRTAPRRTSRGRSPTRLAALDEQSLAADLARIVDVTLAGRGAGRWARLHPLTLVRREIEDDLPGPGLRGAHRSLDRDRVEQLRRAEHAARPSRARHAGHVLRRGRARSCARTPRRCRSGPCWPGRRPCGSSPPATCSAATTTPPTRRCSRRWRGCWSTRASVRGPQGDAAALRPPVLRPEPGRAPASQLLPVHRAVGRGRRLLLPVRGQRPGEGRACRLCKGTGWIEIGGGGMVHPNVFKAVGYDPHGGHRLRVRHGPVADGDAQVRGRRSALFLRARHAFPRPVPDGGRHEGLVQLAAGAASTSSRASRRTASPPRLTLVGLEVEVDRARAAATWAAWWWPRCCGTRPHPGADKLRWSGCVAGGARGRGRVRRAPTSRRRAARSPGRPRARAARRA